jgi:hypothetical protein
MPPRTGERKPLASKHPKPKISLREKPLVIGIVGSRRRNSEEDYDKVLLAFDKVFVKARGDKIVSGGCPKGADRFAEVISFQRMCPIVIHHADWDKHGKGAGIIRNTFIAQDCDILIACVHHTRIGGTEDTVAKALKLGKKVIYV